MPSKYSIFWYREAPELGSAFLYNLRDDDARPGGRIAKGSVIQGAVGFGAAECEVFGYSGRTVPFKPNRKCLWQDHELPCMASSELPVGKASPKQLRDSNYAVAAVSSDEVKATADKLKIPAVKTPEGVWVINVELARFERQSRARRATLL